MGTERTLRVLCVRELQNSISESVHKLLSDQIEALGLSNFYDIQVNKIVGKNGTSFAFDGIKNNTTKIKSYEGIDICWAEEAVKISRTSWGILIPTIRKDGSEIWMTFNPELETDYTYTRFVKQPDRDRSFVVKMTYKDNPWFPPELVAEMESDKQRDYDYYLNVWEGHTLKMLEGTVYAKELRSAEEEGRICTVPWDRETPVDTFWDLGRADNTAIWFAQRVAMQNRVVAYYEASGYDLTHFLKELQKRAYVYGTMNLPHDAKAKRLGSKRTIEEQLRAAGYEVKIVPSQSRVDGINAARLIFPNCYFDEDKCADGLNALRHYRYRVKDGHLSNEPLHDWASDGADAFRYLALSLRGPGQKKTSVLDRLRRKRPVEVGRAGGNGTGLGWMG
jgi:phage terminase large subunit